MPTEAIAERRYPAAGADIKVKGLYFDSIAFFIVPFCRFIIYTTRIMEVHHHSHTARKKWTHFLWEFLMLFLAVFCGFLAENQREHYVEHQREKQFMKSLTEDLERDTLELQ